MRANRLRISRGWGLPAASDYARDVELPHLDEHGAAHMVDVSDKTVTTRAARAHGTFRTTSHVIELLRGNGLAKGDALAVARIAAIAGAKQTADLVPLCHPIPLHAVSVDLDVRDEIGRAHV